MAEELHWYDRLWAQGELGKKQLNRLSNILKDDDVVACKKRVIYLHHHPFDQRPLHQLKDTNKLHDVLMNAVNDEISMRENQIMDSGVFQGVMMQVLSL